MTPHDIAALRALLEKANLPKQPLEMRKNRHTTTYGHAWGWVEGAPNVCWSDDYKGQRDFIALAVAAVNALPALLDRLERAERDAGRFRGQLERVVGVHNAPNDCYATGPLTGDAYLDLVSCPSCEAVAMLGEQNTPTPEQP